ncbi:MAG: OadG family protein [Muribaculaceae bacterium]|nr:OadG family protein [Muribaculaceae bacterium]
MSKKYILSVALCGALLTATPAVAMLQTEPQTEYTEVSTEGDQTNVEGDWVDSKEVDTVQMSEMSRKALQAEKAKNAAENDKFGGAITIIAMCIVVGALVVLSILFLCFGKISTAVMSNKKRQAHGVTSETSEDHHEELDSGETIAAIGMALAEHFGQGHDMEDTILTIKRMRKAYSPWNSKIYNMRQTPEVTSASTHRRPLK